MSETAQALEEFAELHPRAYAVRAETALLDESSRMQSQLVRRDVDVTPGAGTPAAPIARLAVEVAPETLEARKQLLAKQFTRGLTASEARDLRYLEWQVESALAAGAAADISRLERLLGHFEEAAERIQRVAENCREHFPHAFSRERAR